ncbi:MAG: hypothetical protein AB8G15_07315 [Saprospiraceae bacterium]
MTEILDDLREDQPSVYSNRALKFFGLSLCCLIFTFFFGYPSTNSLSTSYFLNFIGLLIPILFLAFLLVGFVNAIRSIKAKEKIGLFKSILIYGSIIFTLLIALVFMLNIIEIFTAFI